MPKPIFRPNFVQIIFYGVLMKEHHFLHIADFHEKIIKKKRFIKFSKKGIFLVLLKKSIFEALQKINHPLNEVKNC